MTRPRKPAGEARTVHLGVRVTPVESDWLDELATTHGVSKSAIVQQWITERRVNDQIRLPAGSLLPDVHPSPVMPRFGHCGSDMVHPSHRLSDGRGCVGIPLRDAEVREFHAVPAEEDAGA